MQNAKRASALIIVNALFWAATMFLGSWIFAGRPWGGDLFLWLIAGFSIANGFLLLALGRRTRC